MEHTKIAVDGGSGPSTNYQSADAHVSTTQEVAQMSVRRVRLTYAILLVIGFVLGIIVKTTTFEWFAKWAIEKGCDGSFECVGVQSVYRISFAMALFFFIHWIFSSSWNLCLNPAQRVSFNQQGVIVKLLSLIPLFCISFAIPNDFFVVFAWVSLVVSVLFLIGQLIILLDFSYSWNEDWASQAENEPKYGTGLLVSTVFLTIGGLIFVALCYKWFGTNSSCQANQAVISLTLILGIFYFGLSIVSPNGSILPSSTVFLYTSYTCFSALTAGPTGECNALDSSSLSTLIISTVLSAVSLVYMTVSAGTSRGAFQLEATEESADEAEANAFAFFHVQMTMGSCYLAMLISDWTILGSSSMATMSSDQYKGPMGAKLASEFVCIALYIWSLVAPMLFPDRDFS